MCGTCGCSSQKQTSKTIDVLQELLTNNNQQAHHNRQLLDQHNILCLNLMSSPGSGKTSLLESTIEILKHKYQIAVIEGDLETENDAERIRNKGVPAVQITTGSACHLEADMVFSALQDLDLNSIDILFIENVGNLVCPASFDLGHHQNITLLSTTEGDDKPSKYPVMFRAADVCIITKCDLLEYLNDFSTNQAINNLLRLGNHTPCFTLSAKQPESLKEWCNFLIELKQTHETQITNKLSLLPNMQHEGKRLHKESHDESESTLLA